MIESTESYLRCLLVGAYPATLSNLRRIVALHFPRWTSASATTPAQAIEYIGAAGPRVDVVLLDLVQNERAGVELFSYFATLDPARRPMPIIVSSLASCVAPERCGSCGESAPRGADADTADAIRRLLSNDAHLVLRLPAARPAAGGADLPVKLTERQRDVVDLVLAGYSNKKIADTLDIACGTVKNYMFDLMRLFGARSRLELALKLQSSDYQPRLGQAA